MKKFLGIIVLIAIIGFLFIACDDGSKEPILTGTVSINGIAEIGQTLTANTDSLGGSGTINYQWKRGNTNIGTNTNGYIVRSSDAGSTITVTVTRTGYSGSVTSNPTASVGLPRLTGTVSINGIAEIGQTLTANTDSLGGNGTITYQWKRENTDIGTNSNTYIVQSADVGSTITVTVTRVGNSGSVTSIPTGSINPKGVEVEMVWINAGTFTMGSPTSEAGRYDNETQHQVRLTKGFYMGKYEVTQKQYEAVTGANPSIFSSNPASGEEQSKRPVERVTWYDAVEFCNKLSALEGLTAAYTITGRSPASGYPITSASVTANWGASGYRLPTEAEWEYACRSGTTTAYNTGETISNDTGWYRDNSNRMTHEVGKKPPNAWGLYDMHGNVYEWCWDRYDSYRSGAQTDPTGASSGSYRVLRGGSCNDSAEGVRSAPRNYLIPSYRSHDLGFRVLRPGN